MRPLPSGARMYPETDVQVLYLESERWEKIQNNLPMNRSQRISRLDEYDISENQLEALIGAELDDVFISGVTDDLLSTPALPAKSWASILLDNTRSEIAKEANLSISEVSWELLALLIFSRENDIITREGLVPIGKLYLMNQNSSILTFEEKTSWISNVADSEGFAPADTNLVEQAVDSVLSEKIDFVKERGLSAVGPLMGMVMGKLGGSADGKLVNQMLLEKIKSMTDE
jgi:glutamyl-tRNA(Gln) amidotransferase subunit E